MEQGQGSGGQGVNAPAEETNTHKTWRGRRAWLIALFPLLVAIGGCRMLVERMVTAEERNAPRDPKTGIMIGAEEQWLGPEDSKRAALFVHGFIGGGNNFADFPQWMADQGWRVRVMRLPAHGTTPRDMINVTADEMVTAVRGELAALNREYPTVAVVAHSMGGSLSTLAVAEEGADYLVLGAPYYGITYKWFYILPAETWNRLLAPVVPWVYKGKMFMMVSREGVKDQIFSYEWVSTKGGATLCELGRRASDPATLARVTCPTLMVHAPEDEAASFGKAKEAFENMGAREKKFVPLVNSNHLVYWDNDADLIRSDMVELFDTAGSGVGTAAEAASESE